MTLFLLLAGAAVASCPDADGDGWDAGDRYYCPGGGDCDDADSTLHPGQEEDGLDAADSDCDGSASVRRYFVSGMEGNSDLTVVNNSYFLNGTLRLDAAAPGGASVTVNGGIPYDTGAMYVGLSVPLITGGASCTLYVQTGGMSTPADFPVYAGIQEIPTGLDPFSVINLLSIERSGPPSSAAVIDWVTVQNGSYVWPPLNDVAVSFSTMGIPGGAPRSSA